MVLPANVPEIDQVVHLARRVLSPGEPFHQLKMALPISTGCLVSQSRRKPGKSRYLLVALPEKSGQQSRHCTVE